MVCDEGSRVLVLVLTCKGQRIEDNRKVEVELYYNFDDSEVLIRKCKLLACEKDVAPLYPDDPGNTLLSANTDFSHRACM